MNCKKLPSGSGTTSDKRKEQRKHKQWGYLASSQPSDPGSMDVLKGHAETLKAAYEKAVQKMEALEKAKKDDEEEEDESSSRSSSSASASSSSSKSKRSRKSRSQRPQSTLEKVQEEEEEKKEEEKALEKAKKEKEPALEKADVGGGGQAGVRTRSRRPKHGPAQKVVLVPAKSTSSNSKPLEKGKPRVVVDWVNALEHADAVPGENSAALDLLLGKAHVHLLSYVDSWKGYNCTMAAMHDLPQIDELEGVHCCWSNCGQDGKASWALHFGAEAIFDDNTWVIKEALQWGLQGYAVHTPFHTHYQLPAKCVFKTFKEAVDAYLESLDDQ